MHKLASLNFVVPSILNSTIDVGIYSTTVSYILTQFDMSRFFKKNRNYHIGGMHRRQIGNYDKYLSIATDGKIFIEA